MSNYTKYKIQSGVRWHVRGYIGTDKATGKQIEFDKKGFKTKKEAQLAYSRAKVKFEEGISPIQIQSNITFAQVYQEWLTHYKKDVKESTLNNTLQIFRDHILPHFSEMRIARITHRHIQKALDDWHARLQTFKRTYNYFLNVMNFAVRMGYIQSTNEERVNVPLKPKVKSEKKTKDFYTREELEMFMNAIKKENSLRWYSFFRLLAFTGIRRGEALALTWDDVNFNDKTISISKTLSLGVNNKRIINPPKTEAGNRIIWVDAPTLKLLKKWRTEQARTLLNFGHNAMKSEQLVFSRYKTNDHLSLASPRNALERICRKNDLEMINVHGFRHTHCSLLFEAGVPMKDVMERLGHSDIQTTMNIYTHVTSDSREESAQKFSNYIQF